MVGRRLAQGGVEGCAAGEPAGAGRAAAPRERVRLRVAERIVVSTARTLRPRPDRTGGDNPSSHPNRTPRGPGRRRVGDPDAPTRS